MGFGMFIGLVLSNLQYIDMQSTRNLAVIGILLHTVSALLQISDTRTRLQPEDKYTIYVALL
jgi:hypothetical protein